MWFTFKHMICHGDSFEPPVGKFDVIAVSLIDLEQSRLTLELAD